MVSYIDVLTNKVKVGERVAIIGAGGIGFDVGEYLVNNETHTRDVKSFYEVCLWLVVIVVVLFYFVLFCFVLFFFCFLFFFVFFNANFE